MKIEGAQIPFFKCRSRRCLSFMKVEFLKINDLWMSYNKTACCCRRAQKPLTEHTLFCLTTSVHFQIAKAAILFSI